MRIFENKDGDWKKTEKLTREIMSEAEIVDQLAKDLVKATKKLDLKILESYKATPKIDCLFGDSPLSQGKQKYYLRSYMTFLGWEGVKDVLFDPTKTRPFSEMIKDGCKWLLKFKEETQEKGVING